MGEVAVLHPYFAHEHNKKIINTIRAASLSSRLLQRKGKSKQKNTDICLLTMGVNCSVDKSDAAPSPQPPSGRPTLGNGSPIDERVCAMTLSTRRDSKTLSSGSKLSSATVTHHATPDTSLSQSVPSTYAPHMNDVTSSEMALDYAVQHRLVTNSPAAALHYQREQPCGERHNPSANTSGSSLRDDHSIVTGTEDDDVLCDRDDDPPMIDDESAPAAQKLSLLQVCSSRKRSSICGDTGPSLHSARKSVVSFSQSVDVHYDAPEEDDEAQMDMFSSTVDSHTSLTRDVHEPTVVNFDFECRCDDYERCGEVADDSHEAKCRLHEDRDASPPQVAARHTIHPPKGSFSQEGSKHPHASAAPLPLVTGLQCATATPNAFLLQPSSHTSTVLLSDLCSTTSSMKVTNQQVITVPLAPAEGVSHREQLARPRI